MPPVILLAMLSTCIVWGWLEEAGIFALSWGGLLRIGEALNATRACLVLPEDVLFTNKFILLRISEPKTRFRTAKHQSAKVDYPDLIELIRLSFHTLPKSRKLWTRSAQTLRKRFDSVLSALRFLQPPTRTGRWILALSGQAGPRTCFSPWRTVSWSGGGDGGRPIKSWRYIFRRSQHPCTFLVWLGMYKSGCSLQRNLLLKKAQDFSRLGIPTSSWFYLWDNG